MGARCRRHGQRNEGRYPCPNHGPGIAAGGPGNQEAERSRRRPCVEAKNASQILRTSGTRVDGESSTSALALMNWRSFPRRDSLSRISCAPQVRWYVLAASHERPRLLVSHLQSHRLNVDGRENPAPDRFCSPNSFVDASSLIFFRLFVRLRHADPIHNELRRGRTISLSRWRLDSNSRVYENAGRERNHSR